MSGELARERPWEDLPPGIAAVLRPALPGLTEAIIAAIAASIPEYKRPIEGAFGQGLRLGVEEALERFVRLIEEPGLRVAESPVYRALGRGEMRAGRSLDALQAAYRLGARIAWRHLADAAAAADIPTPALPTLAEAIFAYIDELAAQSVEGYAEAQSAEAGERGRRRARLLDLLLAEDDVAVDREAVEAAAARAGWPLPRTLAAVALRRGADAELVARRVGADVLSGRTPEGPLALVPDPAGPGRADLLAGALAGRAAAVGPGGRAAARRRLAAARAPAAGHRRDRRAAARGRPPRAAGAGRRARAAGRAGPASPAGAGGPHRGVAGAPGGDAAGLAGAAGQRARRRPASCTCTRRRCATGWPGCARRSATSSTIRRRASSCSSCCARGRS